MKLTMLLLNLVALFLSARAQEDELPPEEIEGEDAATEGNEDFDQSNKLIMTILGSVTMGVVILAIIIIKCYQRIKKVNEMKRNLAANQY